MKKQLIIVSIATLGLFFSAPLMASNQSHVNKTVGHSQQASSEAVSKVDVNTATVSQLASLKRIGAKKAAAIVAYRNAKGPFKSLDELSKVKGISTGIVNANKAVLVIS